MKLPSRSQVARYGIPLLLSAVATELAIALAPLAGGHVFFIFLMAVAASAWWGGLGAGLLATLLAILSSDFFLSAPYYTFSLPPRADVITFTLFTVVALFVGWLSAERGRAAAMAAASRRRVVDTLEMISDGFVAVDRQCRFTDLNRHAEELIGHERGELLGRNVWDVFPEAQGTNLFEQATAAMQAHHASRFEAFYAPRDQWFSFQLYPTGRGASVYFEDVTDRKRTEQRLATQYAVTAILAESPSLAEAGRRILAAVCTALGWEVGVLWTVDRRSGLLHCVEFWHVPSRDVPGFAELTRRYAFPRGIGLPGRVWASAEPYWIPDVAHDTNFPHASIAVREDLHGAFAFPILVATEPLGVLEFFSHEIRQPDEALLSMANAVGSQIGQVMERRRAEEELRSGEERLRLAFEAGEMGAFDWNIPSGRIVWSETTEQLHGLAPGTFAGTLDAFLAAVHPADHEHIRQTIARSLEQGRAEDVEYRTRWPDGTVRWIFARSNILSDGHGTPARITGVVMDITNRKQLEDTRTHLLAAERTARAAAEGVERRAVFLAEASAALSASLDFDGTLATVARLAVPWIADWCIIDVVQGDGSLRRLPLTPGDPGRAALARELERRPATDPDASHGPAHVVASGRSELTEEIADPASVEPSRETAYLAWLRSLGFVSAMCVPLRARGQTLGAITFLSATPERRYAAVDLLLVEELARHAGLAADNARLYREADEANRVKDEFLATLSHELRTPLSAILGWTRLLRSRKLDEPATVHALETIERNTKLQAQLVEDLLDVSRIITGKLRLETRPVDVLTVIESAVDTVRPSADAKAIRLETALDSPGGLISGDPDRLQQVVWNLLSNAIKFTPRAGRVEIRLGQEGTQATVRVSDTGKGIPPEFLPHIFDRFRQADSTTTRAHGGLGLGLALVRHLVELHGGTVEAASPGEGGGAVFTVMLPLAPVEATAQPVTRERRAIAHETLLEGVHVLVVDDDIDARESLVMVLEESGAEVIAVSSAREALQAVGRVVPDVLVSDIAMPDVDGYGLLRRLRALHAERPVPALALTAYAGEDHRRRALAAGFEMHLAKPIDPSELTAAVRSLAGQRPTDRP